MGVAMVSGWAGDEAPKPVEVEATRPAVVDRVGLPADYRTKLTLIRRLNVPNHQQAAHVYANEAAAAVKEVGNLPYPDGAVIVFEWAESEKGADGAPVVDAEGLWPRAAVRQIDVMRKEPGYGAIYGEGRAGEWEFARYAPDGSPLKTGVETLSCATCHRDAARRDFVFRGALPEMKKAAE